MTFVRLCEPFCFLLKLRNSLVKRDNTASAEMSGSTPAAPWFSAWAKCGSGQSTVTLTNHLSATQKTVADTIFQLNRNDSRISTQPRHGMWSCRPLTSKRSFDVSLSVDILLPKWLAVLIFGQVLLTNTYARMMQKGQF